MAGERPCGVNHPSLGDAISHAEQSLGFPARWRLHEQRIHMGAEYCFGTMNHNSGNVIGRQMGPRLRWRLDWEAGPKGAHVNDENFRSGQKTLHPIADVSFQWISTVWRKWTTQASVAIDKPTQDAAYDYLRKRRDDPTVDIADVVERWRPPMVPDAAKFVAMVEAYIAKYDYLPGMF